MIYLFSLDDIYKFKRLFTLLNIFVLNKKKLGVLLNTSVTGQRFTDRCNVFTHLETGSACFAVFLFNIPCTTDCFCLFLKIKIHLTAEINMARIKVRNGVSKETQNTPC